MSKETRSFVIALIWSLAAAWGAVSGDGAEEPGAQLGLVPEPVSVEVSPGAFALTGQSRVLYQAGSTDAESAAKLLAETLRESTGLSLRVRPTGPSLPGSAILVTTEGADPV